MPCRHVAHPTSPERELDEEEGEEDGEDEVRHGVQHGHDGVEGRVLDEHAASGRGGIAGEQTFSIALLGAS